MVNVEKVDVVGLQAAQAIFHRLFDAGATCPNR